MSVALHRDIGAFIFGFNALNPITVTAATTADGTERNGGAIDRRVDGSDLNDLYLSGKVIIPVSYSLAATETVTIASNIQHSSVSTGGWTDLEDKDGSTGYSEVLGSTGSTAAQAADDEVQYDIDLSGAKRYIRVQVTPTLSATVTDTADIGCVLVMGPSDMVPAN